MAQNDILLFAQGASPNILSQAAWAAAAARTPGFGSGTADSATANKLFRQSNWMAYLLSQWIVETSAQNILDDGNYTTAKAALIAAINAQINAIVSAGNFATISQLNGEASQRTSQDSTEATARAIADSNEATARNNADVAIYATLAANYPTNAALATEINTRFAQDQNIILALNSYCLRQNTANSGKTNFTPGDGQQHNTDLVVNVGSQGGLLLANSMANIAGVNPGGAYLRMYLNGSLIEEEFTSLSMTNSFAAFLAPNTSNSFQTAFVTTSGSGQPWKQTGLSSSFMFVSG